MLQPRPTPEAERQTLKLHRKLERIERHEMNRGRRRLRTTLATTALLATVVHPFVSDARANYLEAAEATIIVNDRGDPLDPVNEDSALVILNGLGTNNARVLAETKGEAFQQVVDGRLWSVNYNNAPLDDSAITKRILARAEREEIDQISIFGYSAGGNIGTNVAEELIVNSDIDVPLIGYIMSPSGIDGLPPASRDGIEALEVFADIPGATYSSYARFAIEMTARHDWYDDGDFFQMAKDFIDTWDRTADALSNKELPSNRVIVDQAMAIAGSNIRQSFQNIAAAAPDKLRPVIVYFTADDYVVDNEYSSEQICQFAEEAGLRCFIYHIPEANHHLPQIATEEYMQTLAAASPEIQHAMKMEEIAREQRLTGRAVRGERQPDQAVSSDSGSDQSSTAP